MKRRGAPLAKGFPGLALALCVAWTHPPKTVPLEVTLSDPHGLLFQPSTLRDQMTSLLNDVGIDLGWTSSAGPAAGARRGEVNIVFTSSVPSGRGWRLDPTAMGVYLTNGGSSVVFVFYRRVLSVLGLPAPGERLLDPRERRDVDRALARIAVHELVHRLVPALPHAERGVMRSDLDRHALTRPHLTFDETSRKALVAAIESLAPTDRAGSKEP